MVTKTARSLGAVFLVALAICMLAGCGGGGAGSGTGQLRVSLVDAPLNADSINVDIASVQVHSDSGGWVTVQSYNPSLSVNLLEYSTAGSALLLADVPFKAGHYTMVRLMLSSASIVVGGQTHAVDLTNVTQTGVKCNGQFTVADGSLVAIKLDFNAGKSFVNDPPGSENYKLHPVMTMSPVDIAAEVVGKVELKDASDAVLPIPDGTTVDVYSQGHVGDAAYLISGATVAADGTFRIAVLPQGTYDFRITAGTATKDLLTISVAPPSTDLGVITIQASP